MPAAVNNDNAGFEKAFNAAAAPLVDQVNGALDALTAFEASSAAQAVKDDHRPPTTPTAPWC